MLYFYGAVDQYIGESNYPVPVRLDIGNACHGMMHLAMRHHAHEYKCHYKQIKNYKKELAVKQTAWAISDSEYYHLLATRWVPMTKEFMRVWGIERTPIPLRKDINQVQKQLRLERVFGQAFCL